MASRASPPQVRRRTGIHLYVEEQRSIAERPLVRCLDCDTVYDLPLAQEEAEPCPECGGVGWVALDAGHAHEDEIDS